MSQITADINAFYLIQRLTQNHIMSLRPQRCVQRGVSRGCVYRGCVPRWVCPEGCVQRVFHMREVCLYYANCFFFLILEGP